MNRKRVLRLLHVHRPSSSTDERLSFLEGYRSATQLAITVIAAILTLLGGVAAYNIITDSIDRQVEIQVSAELTSYRSDVVNAAATASGAANQVAVLATSIAGRLSPTSTPSPATSDAQRTVVDYYAFISSGDLANAWALLTPAMRDRSEDNQFSSYARFWEDYDRVDILESVLLDRTDVTASFLVRLEFRQDPLTASWRLDYRVVVLYDSTVGAWRIERIDQQ